MLPFLTKLWRAVRWFLNLSCKLHTHCPQMLLIGHSFLPFYQLCCVPLGTCKHLKTLFKLRTAHSILSEARPMVNVWESPLEWLVVLCLMHPRIDSDWDCCQPAPQPLISQSKPVCSTTLFLWKRTAFFAGPGDFSQLHAHGFCSGLPASSLSSSHCLLHGFRSRSLTKTLLRQKWLGRLTKQQKLHKIKCYCFLLPLGSSTNLQC